MISFDWIFLGELGPKSHPYPNIQNNSPLCSLLFMVNCTHKNVIVHIPSPNTMFSNQAFVHRHFIDHYKKYGCPLTS
jgi:hypothetical protein